MNAPEKFFLPDLQNAPDQRELGIDRVGVRGIRYPITIAGSGGALQRCVATFDMFVALPKHLKGTHMSRFVELLEATERPVTLVNGLTMLQDMLVRLDAQDGCIEMRFTYFIRKVAPVSGVGSLLDYDVKLTAEIRGASRQMTLAVVVPVTSLCPCSKEISAYGAHNQRSHITLTLDILDKALTLEEVVALAEREASCEVFGLLKRPDEKFVTERAYDNPKFAEDLVRDVAKALIADERIGDFVVEAENFESIHNHSAYARITHFRDGAAGRDLA